VIKMKKQKKINKFLYYGVLCTWGIVNTLIGLLVALFMLITGHKPKRFGPMIYFVVNKEWGWGVNFSFIMVITKDCENDFHVLSHEYGHSLQNMIFGVFHLFLVDIPSAIRYWYREFMWYIGKGKDLPDYDAIWFEGTATKYGMEYADSNWISGGNN